MNKETSKDIRSLILHGFSKSIISLLIKITTAGLTYTMFVVLSRSMSEINYGQFAFGFSLATILAIAATMGQETAILRFWPENLGKNLRQKANDALSAGWLIVIIASIIIALIIIFAAIIFGYVTEQNLSAFSYIIAGALLILPLAMAEYGSSALRAQGSVWTALAPRDILWRSLVPLIVFLLFINGYQLTGTQALLLASIILMLTMFVQFFLAQSFNYQVKIYPSSLKPYTKENWKISFWFLMSTLIAMAALYIDIVLVGFFVSMESAGLYFNAFRTAGLMTLFMHAINLIIAPMVAKYFFAKQMKQAQAITSLCTWAGFVFSIFIFIIYILFGDLILSLFGASYADGKIILLLLSAGLLADAATGPSQIVMVMTGHEKQYVAIFGSIMLISFIIMIAIIPIYGIIGAAIINMAARIISSIAIAIYCKKRIGINSSIWGFGGVNFKELSAFIKSTIKNR